MGKKLGKYVALLRCKNASILEAPNTPGIKPKNFKNHRFFFAPYLAIFCQCISKKKSNKCYIIAVLFRNRNGQY